jgi:hypothetical protein
MSRAAVSVFEFSDHVRCALQLTHLLDRLQPSRPVVLFLRADCRDLVTSESLAREVRYGNKYWMMIRFFVEAAILGRKVLVSTGPEAASPPVKSAFSRALRLLRERLSVFMIVRDLKADRGQYLLERSLYSRRSVLAVECDALLRACRSAGYAPDCYIFPTPITRSSLAVTPRAGQLTLLLTGSLDSRRRDYEPLFAALAILRRRQIATRVIVGGHCMSETAPALLERLKASCDTLVASNLLSEEELDAALLEADALVCLNRPEFYGGTKGSGAIGDAFFAGKLLLVRPELAGEGTADAQFHLPFDDGASLAEHLVRAQADAAYLRVPQPAVAQQSAQFSRVLDDWLQLR